MQRILLIDDDHLFTTAITSILEEQDYDVTVAKDGKEATDKLVGSNFSLIVTDMLMPYTNGLEMVSSIRQNTTSSDTPVMVVSGIDNEESIADWFRVGINSYLKKPLNAVSLLGNIKKLIIHEHAAATV